MRLFILAVVWASTFAAPAASRGGFLFENGTGVGFIGVRTPPTVQFPQGAGVLPFPREPEFQLDKSPAFGSVNDGSYSVHAGLYSQVNYTGAFIAIPNGTSFGLSPGFRDDRYFAALEFSATRDIIYRPAWQVGVPGIDGPTYLGLQFSANGYLAPNSSLRVTMAGYIWTGAGHSYARLSSGEVKRNEAGLFTMNYEEFIPFGTGPFASPFDPNRQAAWTMDLRMSIELSAPKGAGASWITLDPGMSTADNPDDLFPWLPAPNPVPEPASCLLGLTGIAGLPWLRRQTRSRFH